MKKRIWILVSLVLLLSGCTGLQNTPTPVATINLDAIQPTDGQPISTEPAPPPSGGVTASGVIKAVREARIGSPSSGRLVSVEVKLGDEMRQGQVLAVLNGVERELATLSLAEKALIEANNQLDDFLTQAKIATSQAQKDFYIAEDDLQDARERLTNLKYQRWLYQTKTQEQIKKTEKDLDAKFSNPSQSNLDEAVVDVTLAEARLADISEQVESLKDGPDPEQLSLLQATVKSAKDQVASAQSALDDLTIKAPFDGTISQANVSPGDMASPGQVLFILTDVSELVVETPDLSERDVPAIQPGQSVSVRIKPLNQTVQGTVSVISVRADTIGGDVVYPVLITLAEMPEGALPGMSVEVNFK